MSHPINIPVQLDGWSVKASWRMSVKKNGVPYVEMHTYDTDYDLISNSGDPDADGDTHRDERAYFRSLANAAHVHHDCWRLIQDFTAIRTSEGLLTFLNATGLLTNWHELLWSEIEESKFLYPVTAFWALQDVLIQMLLSGKTMPSRPSHTMPSRAMPDEWVELFDRGLELRMKRSRHGYVAETHAEGTLCSLIYTAYVKVLQGKKFQLCKRIDCGRVFEVESRGRRKNHYCSHLCAHTAWQRKARKTKFHVLDERLKFGYGPKARKLKGR